DLVEQAERGCAQREQRHDQAHRRQSLLASRQHREIADLLARRLHFELDAAVEQVVRLRQLEASAAASEQLQKELLKPFVGLLERVTKARPRGAAELVERAPQVLHGDLEIALLRSKEAVALLDLACIGDRRHVDVTEARDALLELTDAQGRGVRRELG